MKKNLGLSLLIPTYNEEAIIEEALTAIARELSDEVCQNTEVIVVDDGTDGLVDLVPQVACKLPFASVRVVRNSPPLGKGKSLTKGFEIAKGTVVGFMDVDLSTPPRYIPMAVEAIKSGKTDLFIGSRRAPGSEVKREQFFVKDILGKILGMVARAVIFQGMPSYQDTQCGFKFYRQGVTQVLYKDLVAPDGLNDLEVLLRANLIGYRVQEQGVQWSDLRESKRTLRRILFGEIVAIIRILWTYKVLAAQQRKRLRAEASRLSATPYHSAYLPQNP
jgi:glycosyltransferase involved in cell wall biosynthesis